MWLKTQGNSGGGGGGINIEDLTITSQTIAATATINFTAPADTLAKFNIRWNYGSGYIRIYINNVIVYETTSMRGYSEKHKLNTGDVMRAEIKTNYSDNMVYFAYPET